MTDPQLNASVPYIGHYVLSIYERIYIHTRNSYIHVLALREQLNLSQELLIALKPGIFIAYIEYYRIYSHI